MAKNMLYCYSGTGNCLDMAKNIARALGDTEIVNMRTLPRKTDTSGAKRVGFIFSCNGGGLPLGVEESMRAVRIEPGTYTFGVVQYAGYMGAGLHMLNAIHPLDYWAGASHQSGCIWLMPHTLMVPPLSAAAAQKRSERLAAAIGRSVKAMKVCKKAPPAKKLFALENRGFRKIVGKKVKQYRVNEACVGCGTCERVCPRHNVHVAGGMPIFGDDCIGCLSCVQFCPKAAIDVGKVTVGRERYTNPNITVPELTAESIYIR